MQTNENLSVSVENSIAEIGGCVGIYAKHLQSGFYYERNASERFLMASVFKIPLAVHCLKLYFN